MEEGPGGTQGLQPQQPYTVNFFLQISIVVKGRNNIMGTKRRNNILGTTTGSLPKLRGKKGLGVDVGIMRL